MKNSFDTRINLHAANTDYEIFNVQRLADRYPVERLPYAHKILLENFVIGIGGV